MPKVPQAHLDARRREILMAAHRCFSRRGFHRTTMRDIFAESGLSAGAVYRYFDSKEALVEALAEIGHRNTRSLLEGDGLEGPAPEDLARVARCMLGVANASEGLAAARLDVRLWSEALDNETLRKAFIEGRENVTELLADVIARGQRSGELASSLDAEATARALIAIFLGLMLQRAIEEIDLEETIEAVEALVGGSFVSGSGDRRGRRT